MKGRWWSATHATRIRREEREIARRTKEASTAIKAMMMTSMSCVDFSVSKSLRIPGEEEGEEKSVRTTTIS